MRRVVRLITRTILLVALAGCSGSADLETASDLEQTTEQSVADQSLFETTTTTIATTVVPQVSTTPRSTPDPLAFDDSDVVVIGYEPPTNPDAPGCVAAGDLLLDPSSQQSDSRAREAALIEATNDLLDGAEDAWLAIRDVPVEESEDLETRTAAMTAMFESANQLNQITWKACGLPVLDVDGLMSAGCDVVIDCDPETWAESIPCFEMERSKFQLGPDLSFDQESYFPIDCATGQRIELDREGAWQPRLTPEERARLISVWIVETDIAAGTPVAQALENEQLVETDVDLDLNDPRMIVAPRIELDGMVAARDLPAGSFLLSGDFTAP